MDRRLSTVMVFGTSEPAPAPVPVRRAAGPLAAEFADGVPRRLSWHGVEVVRAIDCPIRDEAWATYPPQSPEERVVADDAGFVVDRRYRVADGALTCRVIFEGRAEGIFRASAELVAQRDFRTNRAGFALLHPLAGLAGSPMTVRRPDGSTVPAEFPRMISPGQPVFDIAGLAYSVGGIETAIAFEGETFEMEDQRNWTDASYKTYCRPLSRPYPYVIAAGETVRQKIEIRLSGRVSRAPGRAAGSPPARRRLLPTAEVVPTVSLVLDATSLPQPGESRIARLAGVRALRLRVRPETLDAVLECAPGLVAHDRPDLELEIVLPGDRPIDECLGEIARRASRSPLRIGRVMALPEAYLRNFQPTDPRPEGPTPRDAAVAARQWFPGARIGSGVLTHFTELNRCRPDMAVCDYLTHGTSAILHAADDRTVVENLEGLAHVCASGRALAGNRDYHLGLVSIGMRTNPHGVGVAPNPGQIRLPAAGIDPRQRGLFAAAWAVGAVAATEGRRIASMALAAPVGAFGIVYRRAAWPQPIYDDRTDAAVYPLFHVVRALAELAEAPRLSLDGLPPGMVGLAADVGSGVRMLLANLSGESRELALPRKAGVRRLDQASFAAAIGDPGWLRAGEPESCSAVVLGAFETAWVDLPVAKA